MSANGRPRTATASLVVLVAVLGVVNGFDFPLSVPFVVRETGHRYLDMCAFCGRDRVEAELVGLGTRGRLLQATLLASIDIIIPVVSYVAGVAVIAALRRRSRDPLSRLLLLLPLLALVLDVTENGLILALLLGYPSPSHTVAGLEGVASGIKFLAYGAVALTMVVLGAARLFTVVRPKEVAR
jgi:hypothetical protein